GTIGRQSTTAVTVRSIISALGMPLTLTSAGRFLSGLRAARCEGRGHTLRAGPHHPREASRPTFRFAIRGRPACSHGLHDLLDRAGTARIGAISSLILKACSSSSVSEENDHTIRTSRSLSPSLREPSWSVGPICASARAPRPGGELGNVPGCRWYSYRTK